VSTSSGNELEKSQDNNNLSFGRFLKVKAHNQHLNKSVISKKERIESLGKTAPAANKAKG